MTKELVTKAIEDILNVLEEDLLNLDHFQLVDRCLEYSGCLDKNKEGFYVIWGCPLGHCERADMRNWLIERRMGELEGQDLEDLLDIVEIVTRPGKIFQLKEELRFAHIREDHCEARRIRRQLRKMGYYISKEGN